MAKKDNDMIEPFTLYLFSLGIILIIYIILFYLLQKHNTKNALFKVQKAKPKLTTDTWKKLSDAPGELMKILQTRKMHK